MSENEQAGSKVPPLRHENEAEQRFWCRVLKKSIPKLGMERAVQAADLAVLALRERSVASSIRPASGSAFEQLLREYRALEKQRDDLARDALACFRETLGIPEHKGTLRATIIAMREALKRLRGEVAQGRQVVEELRSEKAAWLVEAEKLRQRLERMEDELSGEARQ